MITCRLLALLACMSASASAQTGPARPITPLPRPPIAPLRPTLPLTGSPPPTLPSVQPRNIPIPGHPGRFIICPGDRRCPRHH